MIKQTIVPIGAILNRLSMPIPRKVPPIVGTKALQVVSSAVTSNIIGPDRSEGFALDMPGCFFSRGDLFIYIPL
jgi:hypothetical protein